MAELNGREGADSRRDPGGHPPGTARSAAARKTIAALALAALLVAAGMAVRPLVVVPTPAVADEVTGRVAVQRRGRRGAQALKAGAAVGSRTSLTTEAGAGALLCWPEASRVKIGPQAEVRLLRCHVNRLLPGRSRMLEVTRGRIWVRVQPGAASAAGIGVRADKALVLARSATFAVAVEPTGVEVSVYDGQVKVTAGGSTESLDRGKVAALAPGADSVAVSAMTPRQLALWEQQSEVIGPYLRVSSPKDGSSTRSAYVRVAGRTEPGAVVRVNDEAIPLEYGHRFEARVALWEGANTIRVSVQADGREAWQERSVRYTSPAGTIEVAAVSSDTVEGKMTTTFSLVVKTQGGHPVGNGTPVTCSATTGQVTPRVRTDRQGRATITFTYDAEGSGSVITCRSGEAVCTIQPGALQAEP